MAPSVQMMLVDFGGGMSVVITDSSAMPGSKVVTVYDMMTSPYTFIVPANRLDAFVSALQQKVEHVNA